MCLQHSLFRLAADFLMRSYRIDLALFEIKDKALNERMVQWRGRVQMLNCMAYYFARQKDIPNALKHTFEAQKIIIE